MRADNHKDKSAGKSVNCGSSTSASEVTVYQRGVRQDVNAASNQIDDFLNKAHSDTLLQSKYDNRKLSSSSGDMDTSDETIDVDVSDQQTNNVTIPNLTVGNQPSVMVISEVKEKTPKDYVDQLIKDAENSRARIYGVKGGSDAQNLNVLMMDEDYQMLDTHVDENLRKKIFNFEYVDFSRLIGGPRSFRDDEEGQRLEIVNKNGMSYLSPVSEKDRTSISSYQKWEQAFRVFSNVITAQYPEKASELLQYSHTIHSALGAYQWDNAYNYDREFRYHISRHPTRSWALILQQAWTMLLKDRVVCNDNVYFQCGSFPRGGKRDQEPCRRFNKGRCSYGLSCKFDHRCSVKKCGKWGHGAHICRVRLAEQNSGNGEPSGSHSHQAHRDGTASASDGKK